MRTLQQILVQAQRRALIDSMLSRIGRGLAVATILAITFLLLDRWGGVRVPVSAYWAVLAAGVMTGVVYAYLTRSNRLDLAVQLDRSLHLKDRIATAETFSVSPHSNFGRPKVDPLFAELVQLDVQRLAERVDVRAATPIRFTRIWAGALPLVALLMVGILYLPPFESAADESPAVGIAAVDTANAQEESQQLVQTLNNIVAELPRDETQTPLDGRAQAQLEALNRLAKQLAEKPGSPQEVAAARDESAARLTELSEQLAQQSQRDLAAAQELTRRFEGLDRTGAPPPPMSAKEFSEALQRGDFGSAARELEQLLHDEQLSEADRLAAAEHLRDLASHLDAPTEPSASPTESQRDRIAEALRDQGMDDQAIDELLENPPDEPELREQLQEQNFDEDLARQLARDIQKQHEQQQTADQTQRAADEVKESLRQAAEELDPKRQSDDQQQSREPSPDQSSSERDQTESRQEQVATQQPDSESPSAPDSGGSEQPDSQKPQRQQQQQQDATQKPDSESPSAPDSDRGEQSEPPQQQSQPSQDEKTGEQGEQRAQSEQGEQGDPSSPQQAPQPSPAETLRQLAEQRENAQQQQRTAEQLRELARQFMENTTPEQRRKIAEQVERMMRENDQEQSQQPASNDENQPSAAELQEMAREMLERMSPQERQEMAERLQRLQEEQQPAQQSQSADGSTPPDAEQLEQMAREMVDRMSPDERQQMAEQLRGGQPASQQSSGQAGDPRGEAGDPNAVTEPSSSPRITGTEDLDLRGNETADRLIAQWLDDQLNAVPSEGGASSSGNAPQRVRQAQEVAQRAVNESAVQKRYHKAIQRYFGRLNETMQKAAENKEAADGQP